MLNKFDARYHLTSRKYFSQKALPNLYTSVKNKVKQELSDVKHFSATTDLSSTGVISYMSYTVHYISKE